MAANPNPLLQAQEYTRLVLDFFEPQLRRIGLASDQISEQDLPQLETSLNKVNDAISNADSFGKLKVAMTASAGMVLVSRAQAEGHLEIGILPLLLERKSQILDRIITLRPEQQLNEVRSLVATVDNPQERERLIEEIDRKFAEQRAARENLLREQSKIESERAQAKERELQLQIQVSERRAAIYRSFLERESVASVVGAALMLILGITLIIGMFVHVAASDVVSNAFLLILGYFFGTTVMREQRSQSSNDM